MATLIQDAAYHCCQAIRDAGYELAGGIQLSMDAQGSQVVTLYSSDGACIASACVTEPEQVEMIEL